MFHRLRTVTIVIALLLSAISAELHALENDRRQPINVEADRATINKKTGTSTYSGHVIVQQGSMHISADTLTVYTRKGKLDKMLAKGKPVEFQQRIEGDNKDISAHAESMIFQARDKLVIFERNAELRQGANTFSSQRIIYNLDKDTVDAGKKSGGGRVTITIQPSSTDQGHSSQ